jgi:lysyl-tRNA synthetase class 1
VREVFTGVRPIGPMYAFVGSSGMAKMSSSRGGVPTPTDALAIMEVPLLRWLYARRKPAQSFNIAFNQDTHRLYDEWDALSRKVAEGSALPGDVAAYSRATGTAAGDLPTTPRPLSYRTPASAVDITGSHDEQTLRILSDLDPAHPLASLDEARPRLTRAQTWVQAQLPPDQRTVVRAEPDTQLLAALTADQRAGPRLLAAGLAEHWSLAGLTSWVYDVPKIQAGPPPDVKAATPELEAAQREFFVLVCRLLIGKHPGPRLPILLLAVGADRAPTLLGFGEGSRSAG